jgi:hypothetical protein
MKIGAASWISKKIVEDRQTVQPKTTKKVVIFETFPEIEDLWCLGPGSTSLPVSQRQSFESYA